MIQNWALGGEVTSCTTRVIIRSSRGQLISCTINDSEMKQRGTSSLRTWCSRHHFVEGSHPSFSIQVDRMVHRKRPNVVLESDAIQKSLDIVQKSSDEVQSNTFSRVSTHGQSSTSTIGNDREHFPFKSFEIKRISSHFQSFPVVFSRF